MYNLKLGELPATYNIKAKLLKKNFFLYIKVPIKIHDFSR